MIEQVRSLIALICMLAALAVLAWDSRSDRVRLMLILFLASSLMSGCTALAYTDDQGRQVLLFDLRLSGTATQVSVTKPDGTTININRDQDSPEGTLTGVINAVNPTGALFP